MVWRDASGAALADYAHPSVAVDVAMLAVRMAQEGGQLTLLVYRDGEGHWSLPGTFIRIEETLDAAALRALQDKAGVTGQSPKQLHVFDDPARDPRGRVLSIAHADLITADRIEGQLTGTARLAPLSGEPVRAILPQRRRHLTYDHDLVLEHAVSWARSAYLAQPDPHQLLPELFTHQQLRVVHEAVLGPLMPQRDTFRRRMEGQLAATGEVSSGSVGRPAQLFRRRSDTSAHFPASPSADETGLARR